ncbi:MAG: hypothetical protein ABSF03_32220 [Streptosporangiaceae bacterium]
MRVGQDVLRRLTRGQRRARSGHPVVGPEIDQFVPAEQRRRDISPQDAAGGQRPGGDEHLGEELVIAPR